MAAQLARFEVQLPITMLYAFGAGAHDVMFLDGGSTAVRGRPPAQPAPDPALACAVALRPIGDPRPSESGPPICVGLADLRRARRAETWS